MIEDIEARAPLCAVGALLFPDSNVVCQLIRVIERKVRHVVVAQFRQPEPAGLIALRIQEYHARRIIDAAGIFFAVNDGTGKPSAIGDDQA
jgi:hypothetical protein